MTTRTRKRTTGSFEVVRTTGTHEVLDRLFVYGTLRQGQTARSIIANQITRTVPAYTTGELYLFPMGFPGFTEDSGAGQGPARVVGEVLWLSDLAATFGLLDAYEGQEFVRVIKQVATASGEIWAWLYTLADPGAVKLATRIPDGDWVRYWTEQQA